MKYILSMILVFALNFGVSAQEKNKNAKYEVEVNGNCGMCKKRIEKAALSVSGVKMANWDEATSNLLLHINEEKTSLKEVEDAVAKAGHDTKNVKATEEGYNKLHGCCKYDRK